jgi:hypothetical protein
MSGCDSRSVNSFKLSNCKRMGESVTIFGTNFGPASASVLIGGQLCLLTSATQIEIVCTLSPGRSLLNPIIIVQSAGTYLNNFFDAK